MGVCGCVCVCVLLYPSMPTKMNMQFKLAGGMTSGKIRLACKLCLCESICVFEWGWGWVCVYVCVSLCVSVFHPSMPTNMTVQFN
jgi:hypothetical protein